MDGWIGNGGECVSMGISLLTVLFSVNINEYPNMDTLDRSLIILGRQFNSKSM